MLGSRGDQILVRRVCALGDMILTIPWLLALRRVHPGSSLHLLCHGEQGELLRSLGVVHESFPEEGSGWHRLFSGPGSGFPSGLRPDPCEYKHVYLFSQEPGNPLVSILREKIPTRLTTLPARPSPSEQAHASFLPFSAMGLEPEQGLFQGFQQGGLGLEPGRFFVHPASGSAIKNWPVENFLALMEKISGSFPRASWAVLEGPSDQEAVRALCRLWKKPLEVCRPASLSLLASCLREGSFFLGNDSGVTHLAAFLGLPTLAIFGPSDPDKWAPLGSRVQVAFRPEYCQPCHQAMEQPQCAPPCRRFPSVPEAWERFLSLGHLPGLGPQGLISDPHVKWAEPQKNGSG